jgi:type II secretory pathway pseudopilin PulG
MRNLKEEEGLGIVDTLIVLVLISILMGVVIPKYQGIAKEAQESALKTSLTNIRMAVHVYKMVNDRYPDSLLQLVNKQYLLEVREDTFFTQEYLRSLAVDGEGNPLDPFNNRYRYDSVSGYVASTTEGYENW